MNPIIINNHGRRGFKIFTRKDIMHSGSRKFEYININQRIQLISNLIFINFKRANHYVRAKK